MFDLAIRGNLFSDELREGCVYIKDGRIQRIDRDGGERASQNIRLGDEQLLLPAATDLHVHLRDWGQIRKESVETGTMAALAGGVTTVAEMPNTEPRLDTAANLERRVKLLAERSYVDFALHAGVPVEISEVERFRGAGAFAVKVYPQEMHAFSKVAKSASANGLKIVLHAEKGSMVGTKIEELAEETCVSRLLEQIRPGMDVRFAHVSTARAMRLIMKKKKIEGLKITTEVAPHHLFMTRGLSRSRVGSASAVRPSLRDEPNVRSMVSLLRRRAFDFYATDHAPHTKREKFSKKPENGFTGLEIAFPLFLTKESLPTVCRMYCENPARYLCIRKGVIKPGYIADLVIFSKSDWVVNPSKFVSRGKVTPFSGEELQYSVKVVMREGEIVYEDGKFTKLRATNVAGSNDRNDVF